RNRGGIVDHLPNPSPGWVNASGQGRRHLFPTRLSRSAVGWDHGTDPGTQGGGPLRSGGGDAIGGDHHVDSNDRCSTMVIRRFDVPPTLPATISMGLIAIGLLFPVDQPFYQPI